MEQQQAQQVEQELRENWRQTRYDILDQFAHVSTADLDSARDVNDLVQRIADKSHHSERYVETRLQELVGVGGQQGGQRRRGERFSSQQAGQQAPGQPFGSSQQQ
ncbi:MULTISPECIES: hypothetical protein [unclassified Pseudofrankia]|uniref:hypothetical protein n=1 Tax=unclassified Pseudofrankia TaxID=2994372 RepID=UPI0008D91F89|nr:MULTISPECIES: hypothetical protein [unclassified Pseudofrankia]MDT3439321.1 hypothetical protein [Pseudofrankia sp. BMG5.37]OHV73942.1 hypothetical protein BCD48_32895 [Pseudofrankia sp. BMG5.36]